MLAPMPAVSALRSHRRRQVLQECRTFRLTSGIPGPLADRGHYARHRLNDGLPLSVSLLFGDDLSGKCHGRGRFPAHFRRTRRL